MATALWALPDGDSVPEYAGLSTCGIPQTCRWVAIASVSSARYGSPFRVGTVRTDLLNLERSEQGLDQPPSPLRSGLAGGRMSDRPALLFTNPWRHMSVRFLAET